MGSEKWTSKSPAVGLPDAKAPSVKSGRLFKMKTRSVRAREGAELLGCGESTFWRYAKEDPTFPMKRALSPRMSVWDEDELIRWRDSKSEQRVSTS